jgi:hypothetical protein
MKTFISLLQNVKILQLIWLLIAPSMLCILTIHSLTAAAFNLEEDNLSSNLGSRKMLKAHTKDLTAPDDLQGGVISSHLVKNLSSTLSSCNLRDVSLTQGFQGYGADGEPTYAVQIIDTCSNPRCKISNVHVSCGMFSSGVLINPSAFRRIQPGVCLVNNGRPLRPMDIISFTYTSIFLQPLSISYGNVQCR